MASGSAMCLPRSSALGALKRTSAQVMLVDGGWRHTIAATASGLWAWGWNKFGQLGLGRTADVCTPTAVEALSQEDTRMALVSCGWKHTLLVTEGGDFYAMGRGTNGQLGMPVASDQCAPAAHLLLARLALSCRVRCTHSHDSASRPLRVRSVGQQCTCGVRGEAHAYATHTPCERCACRFHPLKVEALCRGRFTAESFQHESTGNERMFVPACDRYALVPGGDATGLDASAVPDAHGSSPKRARVS